MPVGAGSIKRAAKKAADLEEVKEGKKVSAEPEEKDLPAEDVQPEKKPAAGKPAAKKSAGRKPSAKKASPEAKAEEPVKEPEAEPVKEPEAEPVKEPKAEPVKEPEAEPVKAPEKKTEGVRSMRGNVLIANESDILGENKKVEVLQEMPVYLL